MALLPSAVKKNLIQSLPFRKHVKKKKELKHFLLFFPSLLVFFFSQELTDFLCDHRFGLSALSMHFFLPPFLLLLSDFQGSWRRRRRRKNCVILVSHSFFSFLILFGGLWEEHFFSSASSSSSRNFFSSMANLMRLLCSLSNLRSHKTSLRPSGRKKKRKEGIC